MSAADTVFPGAGAAGKAAGGLITPPTPPAPPPVVLSPGPAPSVASAADRLRANQEAADALNRKRGRAASIFTGPEGVAPAATPLGFKTLVGS